MIKSFIHKGLKNFFEKGCARGINTNHIERIRLVLTRLNVSSHPEDMRLPGLKLHRLQGKWKDLYSVSVNGNWRITFMFINSDVYNVDYLDYH